MNPQVDEFLSKTGKWQSALEQLRMIMLDCGLNEAFKWGVPCYTFQQSNVVLIHGFKAYCAVLFHKGALLKDTHDVLIQQTKNVQSASQIRFTSVKEITEMQPVLKAYIYEAIEVEKAGLKVNFKEQPEPLPEEFQHQLNENSALKKAFEALTPGRQRAYNLYFSQAKQSKTRQARVERYMPQILNGQGLNDCTCGLSKKQPYCDGSHKYMRNDYK